MKGVMLYKRFIGSVHYSTDDEVFLGKIEGSADSISFEGSSVGELKLAFRQAVEDYLELCKMNNKQPQKAYKGSFNIRISPDLHRNAAREAMITQGLLNDSPPPMSVLNNNPV